MTPWVLIHNPKAKRGRKIASKVEQLIQSASTKIKWVSLSELHQLDAPPERVITLGGDGTINAVVNWLFKQETPGSTQLGIIPAGTGNNLARGLKLPLTPEEACKTALHSQQLKKLDVWKITIGEGEAYEYMIQSVALGFPAVIANKYDNLRENAFFRYLTTPMGPQIYRLLALFGLQKQKRLEREGKNLLKVETKIEGQSIEETVLAIFIGNERSLGGNFIPCPKAAYDDQILDLCLVRAGTGTSYLKLFQKVGQGQHLDLSDTIVYHQSPGPFQLEFSEDVPILIDGDIRHSQKKYTFELAPSPLSIIS